jgi:hypothetical protein
MNENTSQVDTLIRELLSLNRTEIGFQALPPTARQVEQRQASRKRIRQELVLALSVRRL